MIPGLMGELGKLDSPLRDLRALVDARNAAIDLVDEDVAEAVARAIEAGITWAPSPRHFGEIAVERSNRTTSLRAGTPELHSFDTGRPAYLPRVRGAVDA
jgi:hypothetical protein